MARELQQTAPDDRRRRVQRLKKMIIGIVIVGLLIPILCCVYLICRLHAINGTLRDLEQRLEELDARDRERQTLLQQLQSETAIQQGVQTQEEVTSGEVSEHTPESDPGQEMIHKVYLTFDDGPSIYTDEILDILDRYHVKATFFVVGKDGSEAEAALQRIVEDGHTLGMHSYSHKYKELYESLDSFTEDFARIRDDIYQATGVESVYYRFPGGSSNTVSNIDMHEFIDYLDSQGVEYFDWNVSSGDAGETTKTDVVISNIESGCRGMKASVVLQHDIKDFSVNAVESVIIWGLQNGYTFRALDMSSPDAHHGVNN